MPDVCCPTCAFIIAARFVEGHRGTLWCPSCTRPFQATPASGPSTETTGVDSAPAGCRVDVLDDGHRVSAPARSAASKAWLIACIIWNGVTLLFVVNAVVGLYRLMGGSLPGWVMRIDGNASPANITRETLIWFCLFLVPFVIAGVALAFLTAVSLYGRVEVTLRGPRSEVFTGLVGKKRRGLRRAFDAGTVRSVTVVLATPVDDDDSPTKMIVIEAERRLKLARLMTDARRDWMAATLRELLLQTRLSDGAVGPLSAGPNTRASC